MSRKSSFRAGDIFTLPAGDAGYLTGRILLNVRQQCVVPGHLRPGSTLDFFYDALLVEIYESLTREPTWSPSRPLIRGLFVSTRALRKKIWRVVAHQPIELQDIEFPHFLEDIDGDMAFVRGEVALPVTLNRSDIDRIDVFPVVKNPFGLGDICLYHLGLQNLLDEGKADFMNLKQSDARFSEHRAEIYSAINENVDEPYYEFALRHGYDLSRFYR